VALGAEEVISAFLPSGNLGAAFDLDFPPGLDEAGAVLHVPSEGAEEGVEEVVAELGFGVTGFLKLGQARAERLDQAV
jgi:hypothetical protein